ncbi:P-loop containing nucleoside triphosphate hydrolase protein [Amanita rubescens]|nr:P-loop containing nucleoside triphosphate hydrolase protein [Amanita rubescens]
MQAILLLTYRTIVVNLEVLMHENRIFEQLFKNKTFMSSVISIIIDEAHCISQWGSFCPKYCELGHLRYLQRYPCTIMATSATLTPSVIKDIKNVLSLREENIFFSQCPVDRSNINIAIRPFCNPRNSFFDLKFLLRDWQPGSPPPPTFIVFFDSIPESVSAGRYLHSLLPLEYKDRIMWFNSEMSDRFKTQQMSKFAKGKVWGLMATDSFGMGMDIPNVMTIINWGTSCTISTLWQRFGRCVCDQALEGEAILFTEKENLDPERERKGERARTQKRAPQHGKTVTSNKHQKAANTIKTEVEVVGPDGSSSDEQEEVVTKRSGKSSKQLDRDVDELINVGHQGYTCQRIPIMAAFQNDQAGVYQQL